MENINNTFLFYDYLPEICDYVIDSPDNYYLNQGLKPKHRNIKWDPQTIKEGSIIFVRNLLIDYFFQNLYPLINTKFYLVNCSAGYDINIKFKKYLDDNKIIKWIGTNIIWKHNKVIKVPIGFEENERCINGPASNNGAHEGGDQNTLREIYKNKTLFETKKNKILLPWCGKTHHNRNNIHFFNNFDFVDQAPKLRFKNYMEKVNEYKFVIVPRGTGQDTHRFWETLFVNSVPIVQRSGLDDFYNKFPCIIVDKFTDVSIETLNNFKYDKNKAKNIQKYLLLNNITEFINKETNR